MEMLQGRGTLLGVCWVTPRDGTAARLEKTEREESKGQGLVFPLG